jgi:hypothetical protein
MLPLARNLRANASRISVPILCAGILCSIAAAPGTTCADSTVSARAPRGAAGARRPAGGGERIEESLPVPALDRAEVRAGERVTLHWQSLAGKAEELELVFSLDDGRTFDVRVSPELAGGECRYSWRVPNVGVQRARIRLRARINGVESCGPASAVFRMVPSPASTPGLWVYRAGEWWEDRGGRPFDLPGLVTPPRGPILQSDPASSPFAVPVRAPVPASSAGACTPAFTVAAAAPADPAPPSTATASFHPMRE